MVVIPSGRGTTLAMSALVFWWFWGGGCKRLAWCMGEREGGWAGGALEIE
jgi:hypothetical protein